MNIDNILSVLSTDYNININVNSLSNINFELSTHFLIYKITNKLNNKYYIGQHKTTNIFDRYMGSGTLLKYAENKYGLSNFVKEYLYDFNNFDEMNSKEAELVQLSNCFPNNIHSYNLDIGGTNSIMPESTKEKISLSLRGRSPWKETSEEMYKLHCQHISERRIELSIAKGENNPMYGEKLSNHMELSNYYLMQNKTISRLREQAKDPQWRQKLSIMTKGKNNPMYGHSCTEFMSKEKIILWKKHISNATTGKNNPMFGKNIKDYMTPEKYQKCLQKRSKSMIGKLKGRKTIINIKTNKITTVKLSQLNDYLNNGWKLHKYVRGYMYNFKLNDKHHFSSEQEKQILLSKDYILWKDLDRQTQQKINASLKLKQSNLI